MIKMVSNFINATNNIAAIQIYNLSVYIVIMVVGLILNGTLLFMFVRHKEIRTAANTMIFNQVICDIVNLLFLVPVRYTYHYPHSSPNNVPFCRVVIVFSFWIHCAGALSLVALSIQRFYITVPHGMFRIIIIPKYSTLITIVYIVSIWAMSLLLALPYGVIWDIYGYMCGSHQNKFGNKMMILFCSILICVLLPFLMFSFNLVTARRLKKSIQDFVEDKTSCNTPELARKRSANVVTALCVLFVLTHIPFYIWAFYAYWTDVNRSGAAVLIFEYASKHFLFLSSCCNPIALYMTSSTFRRLFRRYLCCSQQEIAVVYNVQFRPSPSVQHSVD